MNKQFIEILKNIKNECVKHKLENCCECKYYSHITHGCKVDDIENILDRAYCPTDWNVEEIERYIND